jgi:hypothetical protein
MTDEEKQTYEQMLTDAQTYVFNIMRLGKEFSKEEYTKKTEEIKQKMHESKDFSMFTDFDYVQKNINMVTLIQGYGNFGREFINEVFAQDPASALNMFESVVQDYLDLKAAIEEQFEKYTEDLQTKQAVESAVSESNS